MKTSHQPISLLQSLSLYIIFSIISCEEGTEMDIMRNFCKGCKLWHTKSVWSFSRKNAEINCPVIKVMLCESVDSTGITHGQA